MHIYTSKSDSDWVLPSETPAESEPFYLVVTTFPGALQAVRQLQVVITRQQKEGI